VFSAALERLGSVLFSKLYQAVGIAEFTTVLRYTNIAHLVAMN